MNEQKYSLGQYAAFAAGALGVADLINFHNLSEQIDWIGRSLDLITIANIGFLIATPIALIGGALAAYYAYKNFDSRRNFLLILAALFYGKLFPLVVYAIATANTGYYFAPDWFKAYVWSDYDAWAMGDSALRWLWFVPLVMAFIDFKKSQLYPFKPGAVSANGEPASSKPFIASVFSILLPLVGLVLASNTKALIRAGKVSLAYSREVKIAQRNAAWLVTIPILISIFAPIVIIAGAFSRMSSY